MAILLSEAESYAEAHRVQPSLLTESENSSRLVDLSKLRLIGVTHTYARRALLACAHLCGLEALPMLYRDLALMRIIEPASKLQTIELLEQYFEVTYAERTVYRLLPKLIEHQAAIETAAIALACDSLEDSFSLVLYDVTTLYFESFKEYDFQRPCFSKDNKPQQPQIVICHFSEARYKNYRREFEKQVNRALALLERNEPGRRAKFVKKADGQEL